MKKANNDSGGLEIWGIGWPLREPVHDPSRGLEFQARHSIPPLLVQEEPHFGHLPSDGFPRHVHSIVRLRGMLVLEVVVHFPQPPPHPRPLLAAHAAQEVDHEAALQRVRGSHEDTEPGVVKHVLIRKLNLVADYNRNAMTSDRVKQPVRRRRVPGQVKTELRPAHALRGTPNRNAGRVPRFKMHVRLVFDERV
jgi:hypothetical protein